MLKKFPLELDSFAWSSHKKMQWHTSIQTLGSGKIRTMTTQLYPTWIIETKFNRLRPEEYKKLFGFVAMVKGAYEPFLWPDPTDNYEQNATLAEVAPATYQATMRMGEYVEPVAYIDHVKVYANGQQISEGGYTVSDGIITLQNVVPVGTKVTADYRYWWKVMLKDDGIDVEDVFFNLHRSGSFTLVTVR